MILVFFQARVGWTGSDYKNIYCTTHIDTFHVWDTDQVSVLFLVAVRKKLAFSKSVYVELGLILYTFSSA